MDYNKNNKKNGNDESNSSSVHYELNKKRKATKAIVKYSNVVAIVLIVNVISICIYHNFVLKKNINKGNDIRDVISDEGPINGMLKYAVEVIGSDGTSVVGVAYKNSGYILVTNSHLRGEKEVTVIEAESNVKTKAELIASFDSIGMGLLKTKDMLPYGGYNAALPIINSGDRIYGIYNDETKRRVIFATIIDIKSKNNINYVDSDLANLDNSSVFFNEKGEIVGFKNGGASSDIIYSGDVFDLAENAIRTHEGVDGNLGFIGRNVTKSDKVNSGSYIVNVGGLCKNSGLEAGDIILEVNGNKVNTHDEFLEYMRENYFKNKINCIIIRSGEKIEITINNNIG